MSTASVSLPDMGEWTITSQIKIDGQISPNFSFDWEVLFQGHKYIMPLRKPQGAKENTSLNSTIDLTFQHWAIYQLKRWMFFTMQPVESGTAVPDNYIAHVNLNLKDFCDLFSKILEYYYGDKITIDFNDPVTHENGWEYDPEPTGIDISYSYVWDVLIKFYELFAVRWTIEPNGSPEKYVIKVGYPTTEQSHIFEYGFEGGLLKVERQVQSDEICNMLLGRGGEKNLPYRYFKNVDPQNKSFPADPDWIEELADIHFPNLMPATFRSYVQGWKAAHKWDYPGYTVVGESNAYAPWAYRKGFTDTKFNPVEYVADKITINPEPGDKQVVISPSYSPHVKKGSSIAMYGPLLDGVDNNDNIYPSMKGRMLDSIGRIDEAVDIEQILSDDVIESVESDALTTNVVGVSITSTMDKKERQTVNIDGGKFEVPEGQFANFDDGAKTITLTKDVIRRKIVHNGGWHRVKVEESVEKKPVEFDGVAIENAVIRIINLETGEEVSASGIPEGWYKYVVQYDVYNGTDEKLNVTISVENANLTMATIGNEWKQTWSIWIKNIWESTQHVGESDSEYAERIWRPILGDHLGNEAKVVFYDGWLSTSEDYEFVITRMPELDTSKSIGDVPSHWKLTLAKSDADLESTGLYVPSTKRQGCAGDHLFFTGIELPHKYVVLAEIALDDGKKDILKDKREIKPTWVITPDRVRLNGVGEEDALIRKLHPGDTFRLADKRFIDGDYETLYISSLTYTYREPKNDDAALNPDVEIILCDRYEVSANPVSTLQGEVSALAKQLGSISNVEQIVRIVGDKLYLRKDGILDRSISPTEFASLLTSKNFRTGIVGGAGWGFFKDKTGAWVLETDRINVRQDFQVNNYVINQIVARGGMIVESAAQLEIDRVDETAISYRCYFNQKNGSIRNLFEIGDIAYCSRFNPNGTVLKYYKIYVSDVDEQSITLDKSIKSGDGVPEKNDIIVQFGNYANVDRQYVKVRDVIGGGYERYIEGLNSVYAEGQEYYFVGRQIGMYNGKPRFFIGNADSFIAYENGKLKVKADINIESTIGDKPVIEAIKDNIDLGGTNLVLQSDQENLVNISPPNLYNLSKTLDSGTEITVTAWGDDSLQEKNELMFTNGERPMDRLFLMPKISDRKWRGTYRLTSPLSSFGLRAVVPAPKSIRIEEVKIELGNVGSDWSPAPQDTEATYGYLKRALSESTSISGGLVATSSILLGYTNDSVYTITAGINSIYESTAYGGGIAMWAGSNITDNSGTAAIDGAAAFALRLDGTGYMAHNTIKFTHNELIIGEYLHLTPTELYLMQDSGNIAFSAKDAPVGFTPKGNTGGSKTHKLGLSIPLTYNWYSKANHETMVASTFKPETIPLSTLGANAKVSVAIKASFSIKSDTAGMPGMQNAGSLIFRLINTTTSQVVYENDQRAWKMTRSTDSYGNIIYAFNLDTLDLAYATDAGVYEFQIEGAATFDKTDWVSGAQTDGAVPKFNIIITIDNANVQQTIIGNDGFATAWGESLLCATDAGILLRFKDKYIRVDNDGISYKLSESGAEKKLS